MRLPDVNYAAPQLLVDELQPAVAYYRDQLGFTVDFIYESFYASVSRGGARIHLKCAPKAAGVRAHRRENEHLDAHIDVEGVDGLYSELETRGARVVQPLTEQEWACKDFTVEDLDGHILCFSELTG